MPFFIILAVAGLGYYAYKNRENIASSFIKGRKNFLNELHDLKDKGQK